MTVSVYERNVANQLGSGDNGAAATTFYTLIESHALLVVRP